VLFKGAAVVPQIFEAVLHPGSAMRFCGVAIYTHPMSPGSAIDVLNIPKPFPSLVRALSNPSLCESE
jgi:hypothetical protein